MYLEAEALWVVCSEIVEYVCFRTVGLCVGIFWGGS